jgi:hypothetical protein
MRSAPAEPSSARPPFALFARAWPLWRPLWLRSGWLGGWFFHLAALAVMHAITGGGYMLTSRINAARGATVWDPALSIDRAIPAWGWTIVPYVTYYAYGIFTILAARRTPVGRHQLIVLFQGLIAMSLVVFACFLLVPCEIHLVRDLPAELVDGPGWIAWLFRWLHGVDRPWNAWPSHHACISLVIAAFVSWSSSSRLARGAMWIAWALLALSILTTKQHFVFDLASGVALGWSTWRFGVRRALAAADGRPYGEAALSA